MDDRTLLALAVLRGISVDGAPRPDEAAAILADAETSPRLTWQGLLATQESERISDLGQLGQPLAEALVRRSGVVEPMEQGSVTGRAADLVGLTQQVLSSTSTPTSGAESANGAAALADLLDPVLGATFALSLYSAPCDMRFRDAASGEGTGKIFHLAGDSTYGGTVENVSASIEPLNWPRCNGLIFRSMTVVHGTFQAEKPVTDPATGATTTAFTCDYVEEVRLPGAATGASILSMPLVRTRLSCRHWVVTRTKELVEAGMTYQLGKGPEGDGAVTFDSGKAVVTQAGPGMVRVESVKEIRFAAKDAMKSLEDDDGQELLCTVWNNLFAYTLNACKTRLPAPDMATEAKRLSDAPQVTPPGPDPEKTTSTADMSWLAGWIDDLADYWEYAIGVGTRQHQRIEQRRSSSEQVTTEALFYDSLETWEANRPSLREGIDLWVRLLQGGAPDPGTKPERPRIDDIEHPDDLTRQNADFIRTRTSDYLGIGQEAAARIADGSYGRADLVADTFDVWGRLARDWTDGLMRGVRTVNRWADDTPVPQDPRRRVTVAVDIISGGRTLSLGCNTLTSDTRRADGAEHRISPAEVEITPNPLHDDDPRRVTVSVNASGPRGTYSGELLVYDDDPREPLESVSFSITLDGRFERR